MKKKIPMVEQLEHLADLDLTVPVSQKIDILRAIIHDIKARKILESLDFNEHIKLRFAFDSIITHILGNPDRFSEEHLGQIIPLTEESIGLSGWAVALPISGHLLLQWLSSDYSALIEPIMENWLKKVSIADTYFLFPKFMIEMNKMPDNFPWQDHIQYGSHGESQFMSSIAACLYHLRTGKEIPTDRVLENILTTDLTNDEYTPYGQRVEKKDYAIWFEKFNEKYKNANEERAKLFIEKYNSVFNEISKRQGHYGKLGAGQNLVKNLRAMGFANHLIINHKNSRDFLNEDLNI